MFMLVPLLTIWKVRRRTVTVIVEIFSCQLS